LKHTNVSDVSIGLITAAIIRLENLKSGRLRVFENEMLRIKFVPKTQEAGYLKTKET
jgi:hypothetical protein